MLVSHSIVVNSVCRRRLAPYSATDDNDIPFQSLKRSHKQNSKGNEKDSYHILIVLQSSMGVKSSVGPTVSYSAVRVRSSIIEYKETITSNVDVKDQMSFSHCI